MLIRLQGYNVSEKFQWHYRESGAWGGVVVVLVGGFRDRYPVTGDFFYGASDSSMSPGVDSASKNEYQDIRGGKYGRNT